MMISYFNRIKQVLQLASRTKLDKFFRDNLPQYPQSSCSCSIRHYSAPSTASKNEPVVQRDHCNVGTIGHVHHGKTTLTAAITAVLAKENKATLVPFGKIDQAPQERLRGITINTAHVGYRTSKRSYAHIDCPGHTDLIKNMIGGASQMDAAILIVAATDGHMPQTREHLMFAKQIGVEKIIVFVNKCELVDEEMMELVELEMKELLEKYGFNPDKTPFIYGSALQALKGDKESKFGVQSIHRLMEVMDSYVTPPTRNLTAPFLLPIDSYVPAASGGPPVLMGTLKQGIMKKGLRAELLGFDRKIRTRIKTMQIFHKDVVECRAGEYIGVVALGLKKQHIEKGMVLAAMASQTMHNRFQATIYLLSPSEGGRDKAIPRHCTQMLYCDTWNMSCILAPGQDLQMLMPGERGSVNVTLLFGMPVTLGLYFTIGEGKSTIATGKITQLLPSEDVPRKLSRYVDMREIDKRKQHFTFVRRSRLRTKDVKWRTNR